MADARPGGGPARRASARSPPPLGDVIARHGLSARKRLGQNFLLDMNLTRRIVRAAGSLRGVEVVEVGPGPGGLTRAILESDARRVVAIERDARCVDALGELAAVHPDRLVVVNGDALETDVAARVSGPAKIIANLPYNIATALLVRWIPDLARFDGLTLMFQKEVAERLVARPGTKAYGRLSVLVQWAAKPVSHFDVPSAAFVPPPKVTSTVVGLAPLNPPPAPADRRSLERVTAAAFGQRRKMLRSSLKSLGVDVGRLLARARTAPTARPEDLDVAAFCALARALDELEKTDAGDRAPAAAAIGVPCHDDG